MPLNVVALTPNVNKCSLGVVIEDDEFRDELGEDTVVMTVRLSRDQRDRLQAIAAHEDRSIAGEIPRLVKSRIHAFEQPTRP